MPTVHCVNVTLSRDQTLVTCWDDYIDMLLSWHIDIKFMTVLFEMLSLICIHPHSVSACVVVKEDDYNLYHQKTRTEITGHHLRGPQHLLLLQQTQITSGMKCTSISYLGQRKSHQHHHLDSIKYFISDRQNLGPVQAEPKNEKNVIEKTVKYVFIFITSIFTEIDLT